MGRKTKQNHLTSPELLEQVNPENLRLLDDFLDYLKSTGRSDGTIKGYRNDCEIFFVWCLQHASNKYFINISKRDIVAYQNWLISSNENSPARIRRLKSALSSMSNFVEAILDDEYPGFRPIIRKIESPVNQPVREKTVLTDEQCDTLLQTLVDKGRYEKACFVALALFSGRRKAELLRFKVSYFTDENIIYGSLYKTPEKVLTKGRGGGKMLTCYVLSKPFKPYFDLWMEERKKKGIKSEWLFPNPDDLSKARSISTVNSWANTFSNILGVPWYAHACRHRFTTALSRSGIPDNVIKEIVGWQNLEMVALYRDTDADEEIGKFFADGEIIPQKPATLQSL